MKIISITDEAHKALKKHSKLRKKNRQLIRYQVDVASESIMKAYEEESKK